MLCLSLVYLIYIILDENELNKEKTTQIEAPISQSPVLEKKGSFSYAGNYVRTSRSEDFLQKSSVATVNIEIDDDFATSLNNLLETDKENSTSSDRIVWTYNAPVSATGTSLPHSSESLEKLSRTCMNTERTGQFIHIPANNIDQNSEDTLVNGNNINNMITTANRQRYIPRTIQPKQDGVTNIMIDENKIYVKVLPDQTLSDEKIPANKVQPVNNSELPRSVINAENNEELKSENSNFEGENKRCYSPEDESDVESLSSFHYSPKAIDMPSASRLAKRLFNLEGFKKSDVSRHLCKK